MAGLVLTAHGFCTLADAEAQMLDWFDSEGLELVHGQNGVLIGWGDPGLAQDDTQPPLVAEVRFYDLGGGWLQGRWTLQLSGESHALQDAADALLLSLRAWLAQRSCWTVDAP